MRVTLDREALDSAPELGAVLSLGVFDGVHLGHQAILEANVAKARELGAESTVLTFSAHPKSVLLGRAPRTLTTLDHRLELFERAGIGHTVALPFDEELRRTPPEQFARDFLIERLGTRHFVLGFDSQFGEGRRGNADLLIGMGFPVSVVPMVIVDQRGVSSTAIREAVELGDLEGATRMLGRPVAILGEVIRGKQLGRQLGFPTANLDLHHELHPPVGVYACRAHVLQGKRVGEPLATWNAVCNIGFRPTVEGQSPRKPVVEAFLLDFEGDLYGRRIELEFVQRLRAEQHFPGLEALKEQIAADVRAGRELFDSKTS
ncbi:MAG: riboflavin kinase/FMN adenylyltransferase [Candidatus Paceibacteria bacterium]|jgi:riboflavin kinase/FMN adenylyltransferase